MVITDVQQQKRNTSRFNLYIDSKFYAGISTNTLAKFNLYKEKEIEDSDEYAFNLETKIGHIIKFIAVHTSRLNVNADIFTGSSQTH